MIEEPVIMLIMNCKNYEWKADIQRNTWLKKIPSFITYYHVIGNENLESEYKFVNDTDNNNNNDNNIIEEHFSNINDYCIDLENKLKLENLDNIIKYYNQSNTNIRQSNDLNNLNIDDTNSLNINDNMNYLLLNDTKCNYN